MESSIVVRPVEVGDFPWIIDLIDRNRAERLTAAARASRGFVQGQWDAAKLYALLSGPGTFLAQVGAERAGVVLSTAPGTITTGPAGRTNDLAAQQFGADGYFLYGPVVVDEAFRGRGVLHRLADHLLRHVAGRYRTAVAFVEMSNPKSLAVHRHLGWEQFATFAVGERGYAALARPVPDRTDSA